jgi:hypothetical protein
MKFKTEVMQPRQREEVGAAQFVKIMERDRSNVAKTRVFVGEGGKPKFVVEYKLPVLRARRAG